MNKTKYKKILKHFHDEEKVTKFAVAANQISKHMNGRSERFCKAAIVDGLFAKVFGLENDTHATGYDFLLNDVKISGKNVGDKLRDDKGKLKKVYKPILKNFDSNKNDEMLFDILICYQIKPPYAIAICSVETCEEHKVVLDDKLISVIPMDDADVISVPDKEIDGRGAKVKSKGKLDFSEWYNNIVDHAIEACLGVNKILETVDVPLKRRVERVGVSDLFE